MATVTINGVEIADDPRAIRRELGKVRRAEKAAEAARRANSDAAQQRAEASAYRILWRHAKSEPGYWDYYAVPSEHGSHYVRQVEIEHGRAWEIHDVPNGVGTVVMLNCYGGRSPHRIVGVITDRSGFVRGLAIEYDGTVTGSGSTEVMVYGFGAAGNQWHLADCPGVGVDFFSRES